MLAPKGTKFANGRAPDLIGSAKVRTPERGEEVADCAVFLPRRHTERIWLLLRVSATGATAYSWKFSAEVTAEGGTLEVREAFHSGWQPWKWNETEESTLLAEATDVTISQGRTDAPPSALIFFVSPSALLRPVVMPRPRTRDHSRLEVIRPGPVCRVSDEITIRFTVRHRRISRQQNVVELVARIEPAADLQAAIPALEQILLLASLAEGAHLVWTGWEMNRKNGNRCVHYRRNFTMRYGADRDTDQTLISPQDIELFLNETLPRFRKLENQPAVERAIDMVIRGQGRAITGPFVMMFSGIECFLTWFRRQTGMDKIVKQGWSQLREAMEKWITTQPVVAGLDNRSRGFLLGKIGELNRVSFADAFTEMSREVDMSDLWPTVGRGQPTLSNLRNKVVHGEVFDVEREFALVGAKQHLLWTLERLVLHILGWPIVASRVSPLALSQYTLYHDWREYRKTLAGK